MVTLGDVRLQLRLLGYSGWSLSRGEVRELPQVLREYEQIKAAVYGSYSGGFGMLVATNQRLLFVDRHFFRCHISDIPYDSINSVEFDGGLLTAAITVNARVGTVSLRGMSIARARRFFDYIDRCIEQYPSGPVSKPALPV